MSIKKLRPNLSYYWNLKKKIQNEFWVDVE